MSMGTILISINPQHVEKILTGLKKCEYRTRKPNRDVNTMIIYEKVLTLPKEELWNKTKDFSGTTKERFDKYFKKQDTATGFIIKSIKRCNKDLIDYGIKFVPQSYIYLD